MLTTLLLAAALQAAPVPSDTPVNLAITLRLTHPDELAALQKAQQDPRSGEFRRWLTPQEFGARFGQSEETYREATKWFEAAGFKVTTAPNRAFFQALGTAGQVQQLLKVKLTKVEGQPATVHTFSGKPQLPASFAAQVLHVGGLDTRIRFKHRLLISGGLSSLGPQDLRAMYNLKPLHDQGYTGQGLKTAVLSTAESTGNGPSPTAISWFFQNVSNASAKLVQHVIPNPQNDVDPQPGAGIEFDLDTEMHSVGVPGADSIILVVSPASTVFSVGAQEIANNLPDVAAVSISLGICEPGEQQNPGGPQEAAALRQAVTQGTMEGQTWSAATGDNGADDCRNGQGPTVDFPANIPEMLGAGGTELKPPTFDGNHAINAYQQEVVWNDGTQGGAAGGGVGTMYLLPSYQSSIGLTGTGRLMPDFALMAGNPGVAVASSDPPGPLDPVLGTSVASPLSAGMFALIASRLGCRLGDVHSTLYALGASQYGDGGTAVFHDIISGDISYNGVTGPAAAAGFDTATGLGALDVNALANAFPPCPANTDAGIPDAGPGTPYDQCVFAGCDAGCLTIPEGPSTCEPTCSLTDGGCAVGTVCNGSSIFAMGNTGLCVPGCASATDCAAQAGTVCSLCAQVCVPAGNDAAAMGSSCTVDADCPSGAFCYTGRQFTGGYCTLPCTPGASSTDACACPSGSQCGSIGRFQPTTMCVQSCSYPSEDCGRTGYICQPQTSGGAACLPKCTIRNFNGNMFDTCGALGTTAACDLDSGVCGGPKSPPDAGSDAGMEMDAGAPDAGTPMPVQLPDAPLNLGKTAGGCGCGAAGPLPFGLGLLLLIARRRRP